jgi:peptidoglycan hydrolase-like protein with peptidoglycan-binding domain
MQGPAVTKLQERLQALGFLQGAVDGVFGPATQAAVIAAQQEFQLEPDGVVGPATWTALLR